VAAGNISPVVSLSHRLRRWWESRNVRKKLSGRLREHSDKTMPGRARTAAKPEFNSFQWGMIYLSTGLRLGLVNIARAMTHRICRRTGIYRWLRLPAMAVPFELHVDSLHDVSRRPVPWADRSVLAQADELLRGRASYFSAHVHDVGNPPDWFLNPFQDTRHPHPARHWSKITDFDTEAGDIKIFWELSRFTWAPVFARAWQVSGDPRYLSALRLWIQDWWQRNPPNTGPNWMCGQEASIRLTNTLLALRIAGLERNVGTGLEAFVETHCRRIDLTTFYAVAQDNNHATSEATGLLVGGMWLAKNGESEAKSRGQRWAAKGRKLLEGCVSRLILPDGSFSQHSLTYHRMMLGTLCIAEAWRRSAGEASFSKDFYERAAAATRWLGAMIDPQSGDGPNLGANDGSHLYNLDSSAYRDFRPCLQVASLLFLSRPALEPGPWDESAAWLGISAEGIAQPWLSDSNTFFFPDGGYVIMRNETGACALLRTPTAQFRPAQADALQLDLWWRGTNLLRDGGTYSYADGAEAKMLSSVVGHNLYEFDDHDQMPRLGRFLYGGWVRVAGAPGITTTADGQSWAGSYSDVWGARHKRSVTLKTDVLTVLDEVLGFKRKAVLRWRLAPGNWMQNETGCACSVGRIQVESSAPIRRMSLESGWESRHYLEKSAIPVLEVEIDQSPAVLTTTVTLS
jgi:hypothetical protein